MSQIVYIRDIGYKEMIKRDINIQEFVNEAIQEKLRKEYNKDE